LGPGARTSRAAARQAVEKGVLLQIRTPEGGTDLVLLKETAAEQK
jgi:hypothetical protein